MGLSKGQYSRFEEGMTVMLSGGPGKLTMQILICEKNSLTTPSILFTSLNICSWLKGNHCIMGQNLQQRLFHFPLKPHNNLKAKSSKNLKHFALKFWSNNHQHQEEPQHN